MTISGGIDCLLFSVVAALVLVDGNLCGANHMAILNGMSYGQLAMPPCVLAS